MGTVLLTLVWPDSTDSLVIDSLPSGNTQGDKGRVEQTTSAGADDTQIIHTLLMRSQGNLTLEIHLWEMFTEQ